MSYGRRDGVAIIAEGVVLDIAPEDLADLHDVERDDHGHLRIAEVNIGEILKVQVVERLRSLGIKTTIAAKNIGYELRCADPIPFDMEYTRDLGYCAAKFLLAGGAAMISIQGATRPHSLFTLIDSELTDASASLTPRRRVRDRPALRSACADDFEDPHEPAKLAATAGMAPEESSAASLT
jgi:6-phosphofructokinase 1